MTQKCLSKPVYFFIFESFKNLILIVWIVLVNNVHPPPKKSLPIDNIKIAIKAEDKIPKIIFKTTSLEQYKKRSLWNHQNEILAKM